MKRRLIGRYTSRMLAASLLVAGSVFLLEQTSSAWAVEGKSSDSGSFTEKMKEWQEKMSEVFRDTWKKFGSDKDSQGFNQDSKTMASVDLREQSDSYTVRLNLPGRDLQKAEISLVGDTLRIIAPAEGAVAHYEQTLVLDRASNAKPTIDRRPKDNLIVVTVPKAGDSVVASRPLSPVPPRPNDTWDRDVINEMTRMEQEMERIFNQGFNEFRHSPDFGGFFDQLKFDSSLDLHEENGNYVVKAYLPNHVLKNVKVTIEGRVLKIEAKDVPPIGANPSALQESHYSQMLTLPGPVHAEKMKIDHKENMLIVPLPKT